MNIRPVATEVFYAYRLTDDEANSRFSQILRTRQKEEGRLVTSCVETAF